MNPSVDIEELERLHAEAMRLRDVLFRNRGLEVRETKEAYECLNALPGLLAELKALRKVEAVARQAVEMVDEENERDALRRVLAEVPK
jgi:hypothetical protein